MRGRPAAARRLTSSARTAGSSCVSSFCNPSRGPTSQTTTFIRTPPTSVASQHALLFELQELGVREAEQAAVDVAVVAAFVPRRRPAQLARRARELRHDP